MKLRHCAKFTILLCMVVAPVALGATTQKTTRYEAEDAAGADWNIASWGGGFSGAGFVVSQSASGDYLEWTVAAEAAGSAELLFGYTLGGSNDRPMEIKVNGVVVAASHSFPPTGGWDKTYEESASLAVTLNAGNNTIRATAIGQGPQMDYLQVKEILSLSGEVMTVFDGPTLTGTSANIPATHIVYSGVSIPGDLDNQISSFILTEGYMAVVADSSDGTQSSKVYIAHDGPLTVNSLPANLDTAISYIRVMPWKNTLKKGFCGGDDGYRSKFDHSWYYSWTKGVERGLRTTGPEFAPMCWDEKYVQIDDFLAQEQVTHLLSFNEPDGVNQANMPDIAVAVGLHKELEKAGLRLGSPACEEQDAFGAAGKWLPDFMTEANAQGVRVDYINVHWYDWGSSPGANPVIDPADAADRLRGYLANVYAHHRKPIWLTEFNVNPARSRDIHDGFLQEVLPYLDDLAYVERYAYYQWGDTMKFVDDATGELTTTGQIYNDHQSPEAYVSLDLPAEWQAADIGTTHEGAALYNGNFTISGSGTGLSGAGDGFHYVYQQVSGDVTITAKVSSQIWRNNLSMSGVMIRESLNPDSKQATMALSASQGSKFRTRTTTGGSVTAVGDGAVPRYNYWVRLVRQGDTITGYQSPDGITWTQLGSPTTITMGTQVYVGMAVTSYNDGGFNDAIIKNVSVTESLGESIYIDWTRNSFAGPFTATPTSGNPDGDSFTNLQEFAFGMDPTRPAASAMGFVMGGDVTQAGAPAFMNFAAPEEGADYRAVFLRREDHVLAGLIYTVDFSADLTQWTTSGVTPTRLTDPGSPNGLEAVSVPYPATVPANSGSENLSPRFFRVGVDMP